MAKDLISKKTRNEFREYFVGTSLREIEMEFDAADVPFDGDYDPNLSGQRRSLVEQYYHAVDFSKWKDVRKILTVYENVLAELEARTEENKGSEWETQVKGYFNSLKKWIERDGYLYTNGRLLPVDKSAQIHEVTEVANRFDIPELQRQIERMRDSVEDDPDLAIGTAKELVETTCKTILTEREVEHEDDWEIMKLVKETRKSLGLVPDEVPDSAKGSEVIRRLLSNLGTIAQGLGELRNLYGTGHGRAGRRKGLSPRHARLAVGSAATLATFLLETHEQRHF